MQAMILAAGFGTRLLPYSSSRPKPLFPLLNIPLLLLTIRRLQACGFDYIIVNCHHLAYQIEMLLSDVPGVVLQQEEIILGTGGALGCAVKQMRDEPLLVTNGDIYHTIDMAGLYRRHQQHGHTVSLAVHDYPRFNSLCVAAGRVCSFDGSGKDASLAFTGIHVINPAVLQAIDPNHSSSIIERYRDMLGCGEKIAAVRVDRQYWKDMGTVKDYLDLHEGLLTGKVPCLPELQSRITKPFWLEEDAVIGENLTLTDWSVVGRAKIGRNVTIARSVVWDGAVIADNSHIIDTIAI
jgi:NDP-sugar pyrophosphorylase family protein